MTGRHERLANGQIHRSQGHRPWSSNQCRTVWPTAKINRTTETHNAPVIAEKDAQFRRPRPGRTDMFSGERLSGLTPRAKNADSSGAMHAQPPRTGPPLVARGGSPETGGAHHDVAPDGGRRRLRQNSGARASGPPNTGESGYLIRGRTVSSVLRRAAPLARRPWTSFGQRSISSWSTTPVRPTTVGTLSATSWMP